MGRNIRVFVIWDRKKRLKENLLVELYLNVVRKGG
jgi:hypothetical protein